MITEKMRKALNEQINAELFSAYLYMAMSADFTDKNLMGFANWMKVQAQEEMTHAMKFYDYILGRGGRADLMALEKPQSEWKTPLSAFEAAYAHEQMITGRINSLVELARSEKDPATESMLNWFVDEQVEEESNADELVQKLKMIGDDKAAAFFIDQELKQRVFVDSTKANTQQ
jgi:ferritin